MPATESPKKNRRKNDSPTKNPKRKPREEAEPDGWLKVENYLPAVQEEDIKRRFPQKYVRTETSWQPVLAQKALIPKHRRVQLSVVDIFNEGAADYAQFHLELYERAPRYSEMLKCLEDLKEAADEMESLLSRKTGIDPRTEAYLHEAATLHFGIDWYDLKKRVDADVHLLSTITLYADIKLKQRKDAIAGKKKPPYHRLAENLLRRFQRLGLEEGRGRDSAYRLVLQYYLEAIHGEKAPKNLDQIISQARKNVGFENGVKTAFKR